MSDLTCGGWAHVDQAEPEPALCAHHRRTTGHLDNHRAAQIARQCSACVTLEAERRHVNPELYRRTEALA